MLETPSLFCPLIFTSQFTTNTSAFNVHWMLHQVDNEQSAAQLGLALIRNETGIFLMPTQTPVSTRQRRGSGAGIGLAALAAVGLFGGGLMFMNLIAIPNKTKKTICNSEQLLEGSCVRFRILSVWLFRSNFEN